MNHRKAFTRLLLAAAFVAATLQGSRLPQTPVPEGATPAQSTVAHRAGSGADPEDAPPVRGGVQG